MKFWIAFPLLSCTARFWARYTHAFTTVPHLHNNGRSLTLHDHDSNNIFAADAIPNRAVSVLASSTQNAFENGTATAATPAANTSKKNPPPRPFANFSYEDHWYPVIWERDLEPSQPTKVTIFDTDYAVAKIPSRSHPSSPFEVIALKDYCTHKGASLTEGRLTSSNHFQCGYHGWTFDGTSGECLSIPQIAREEDGKCVSATIPSRTGGEAVPAMIHQGMVWLFPGGGLEKALAAPPPPSVPGFEDGKLGTYVRDFPVDFPILLSNICDPDHGLFAHQDANFDMYTSSLDCPFEEFVSEETDGGKGWMLRSKVDSRDKLTKLDRVLRDGSDSRKKKGRTTYRTLRNKKSKKETNTKTSEEEDTPWATFQFQAPSFVKMQRVNKQTGESKFISTFYVCPVGVGRSRFFGGSLSKLSVPRWINYLLVSNFLDQDTYLLATQQKNILAQEANDLRTLMEGEGIKRDDAEGIKTIRMCTRGNLFSLPSPTDRIGSKMELFWDSTLARCPNRVANLLKLDESGAFLSTPPREVVLDRKSQNLDICADSRGVVRNCRRVKKAVRLLSIGLVLVRSLVSSPSISSSASVWMKGMVKASVLLPTFAFLSVSSFLADKLEKEYYFKYTDDMRRLDMSKIPKKIWLDR